MGSVAPSVRNKSGCIAICAEVHIVDPFHPGLFEKLAVRSFQIKEECLLAPAENIFGKALFFEYGIHVFFDLVTACADGGSQQGNHPRTVCLQIDHLIHRLPDNPFRSAAPSGMNYRGHRKAWHTDDHWKAVRRLDYPRHVLFKKYDAVSGLWSLAVLYNVAGIAVLLIHNDRIFEAEGMKEGLPFISLEDRRRRCLCKKAVTESLLLKIRDAII